MMRGDVWVKENSNGEKVVCIDNGKFVSEKIIKLPPAKYKINENPVATPNSFAGWSEISKEIK